MHSPRTKKKTQLTLWSSCVLWQISQAWFASSYLPNEVDLLQYVSKHELADFKRNSVWFACAFQLRSTLCPLSSHQQIKLDNEPRFWGDFCMPLPSALLPSNATAAAPASCVEQLPLCVCTRCWTVARASTPGCRSEHCRMRRTKVQHRPLRKNPRSRSCSPCSVSFKRELGQWCFLCRGTDAFSFVFYVDVQL